MLALAHVLGKAALWTDDRGFTFIDYDSASASASAEIDDKAHELASEVGARQAPYAVAGA